MNRRPGFSRVSDEPGAVHLLDATQRPPESAQGQDLFALLLAQDVGHPGAGSSPVAAVNVPARSAPLAGFQVSINGRFWVSPEVRGLSGVVSAHAVWGKNGGACGRRGDGLFGTA